MQRQPTIPSSGCSTLEHLVAVEIAECETVVPHGVSKNYPDATKLVTQDCIQPVSIPGVSDPPISRQHQLFHPRSVKYKRASQKPNSYVQPSTFDTLAGARPASAMDGWAE